MFCLFAKKNNITRLKKLKPSYRGQIQKGFINCVPELSKNLLSVNAFTEHKGEVIFTKEKVIIVGCKQPELIYQLGSN